MFRVFQARFAAGKLRATSAALTSLWCSGCAIHPLPQDYAPLNTVEIVEHIRCEMYDALRSQIILIFELTDTDAARAVAADIKNNPQRPLQDFKSKLTLLKPDYQSRVTAFKATTIGYGFRFNITEQNTAKSEMNFGLPWNPLSNFTLKAAGGLDKKRSNTRRFIKVDSFEELLLSNDCLQTPLREANIIYPITGTVGLKTTVDDFFKLVTRGARTESDPKDVKNFSEQLTFTTELSGSINPKVKLSPITDHFKVADVSGELSAKRTDIHELTVTFDIGKNAGMKGLAAASPQRTDAVVQELNTLRFLDAVERGGSAGGLIAAP